MAVEKLTCRVVAAAGVLLWASLTFADQATWRTLDQPGGFVVSLTKDDKGHVWVGTEDQGLFRFDPITQAWAKFNKTSGLSANDVYALSVDREGRVWAGLLNGGVSVYNGEQWRNYSPLEGPIGERVFDIACSPVDGDVWLATNHGLTRYRTKEDHWQHYDRISGLPADQLTCLAFDAAGNLIVGSFCDGLAVGTAVSDFTRWRTIRAPEMEGSIFAPAGAGLPSNLINDIIVTSSGAVVVASCGGLAIGDKAATKWSFVRGRDWVDKAKLSRNRPRGGAFKPPAASDVAWLPEDYVTCLAEDPGGGLWIGTRTKGCIRATFSSGAVPQVTPMQLPVESAYVKALLPLSDSKAYVACYLGGLVCSAAVQPPVPDPPATGLRSASSFPAPATAPTSEKVLALVAAVRRIRASPADARPAYYVGEDWLTRGDFFGSSKYADIRYGSLYARLCAHSSPFDAIWGFAGEHFICKGRLGEHARKGDALRHWVHWKDTKDSRTLKNPFQGGRRQSEWDDHGEVYPMAHDGPHMYADLTVPSGAFYLTFYNFNKDGHTRNNRYRDYVISIKSRVAGDAAFLNAPLLARARTRDFWGGVYQTFLIRGPSDYTIEFHDNWSFNTIIAALFVDPVGPPEFEATVLDQVLWIRYRFTDEELRALQEYAETGDTLGVRAVFLYATWESLRTSHPVEYARLARSVCGCVARSLEQNRPEDIPKDIVARVLAQCYHGARMFDRRDRVLHELQATNRPNAINRSP